MVDEKKLEVVQYGAKIAHILEYICLPNPNVNLEKFCRLHWRCQDWFDQPDWDQYEKIVQHCKEIMEAPSE